MNLHMYCQMYQASYLTCQMANSRVLGLLQKACCGNEVNSEHFKLDNRGMRFGEGTNNTELIINEHVILTGIPEEAHQYVVNGRTPLEWFIDQYKIQTKQGIVNDPNGWFANPEDLVRAIKRIVYMSVESARIIDSLSSQPIL